MVYAAQIAFHGAQQLACRTVDRLVHGWRTAGDGHWGAVFQPRLDHATLVAHVRPMTNFVTQVNLDSGDVASNVSQCAGHDVTHVIRQCFVALDVVVGVDLYLHDFLR
jgi:hypothetical protein